jgi:hypothetical protein
MIKKYFLFLYLLISLKIFASEYDEYFKNNVICRASWGACVPQGAMDIDLKKCCFAIHHSAGTSVSNSQTVKNIQCFHMNENKWSDIGYHFLIGIDGKCFEGRELKYKGSHISKGNTGNIGICFLGCFESTQPNNVIVAQEMVDTCSELINVLSKKYKIKICKEVIKGHKQHKNAQTLCPGDLVMACLINIINQASGEECVGTL